MVNVYAPQIGCDNNKEKEKFLMDFDSVMFRIPFCEDITL